MNIIDIIDKKKNGLELNHEEIKFFITGYVKEEIPDYQISSLLMAIRINGMTDEETVLLTEQMIASGEQIKYTNIDKIIVDKHSTGGVGDKTSLVLVPLLASLGFAVSKMSGRGLGYTGGTIDKLDAISGFHTNLDKEHVIDQVKKVGCVIMSQTDNIVPADKKLYALRDVTATVDSLPLIASSIMSKKIALGADVIVLDVKYGYGAFMPTIEEAKKLAGLMIEIGNSLGRKTIALITQMNQPLGYTVGNAIELKEAIDVMQNNMQGELYQICSAIAKEVLLSTNSQLDEKSADNLIASKFKDLEVYNKFCELVVAQGGQLKSIENVEIAKKSYQFKASQEGYINQMIANEIGHSAMILGAGRMTKNDELDLTVGYELNKKINDYVQKDDVILTVYYNDEVKLKSALEILQKAIKIGSQKVENNNLIDEIMI